MNILGEVSDSDGSVAASTPTIVQRVYENDYGRLVALSTLIIGSSAVAEELVQDVFARLLAKPHLLRADGNVGAYVTKAVANQSRSRLRRAALERRHRRTAEVIATPELAPIDDELLAAVRALPVRQRQVVALRFYDDRSVDQIATTLGVSSGTVKTHLHRALATLRRTLQEVPE